MADVIPEIQNDLASHNERLEAVEKALGLSPEHETRLQGMENSLQTLLTDHVTHDDIHALEGRMIELEKRVQPITT